MKIRNMLVLALVVALSLLVAPSAMADQFHFTFTTNAYDGVGNSGPFVVNGTLFGNSLGANLWNITSGTIKLEGSTNLVRDGVKPVIGSGVLIANPNAPGGTNQIGYLLYDDLLSSPPGVGNPFVNTNGLLFQLSGGVYVNIFSGYQDTVGGTTNPFAGPGTNTYDLFESNNYTERGELNISHVQTPEPCSLLLLGSGALGLLGIFRKK